MELKPYQQEVINNLSNFIEQLKKIKQHLLNLERGNDFQLNGFQ